MILVKHTFVGRENIILLGDVPLRILFNLQKGEISRAS